MGGKGGREEKKIIIIFFNYLKFNVKLCVERPCAKTYV